MLNKKSNDISHDCFAILFIVKNQECKVRKVIIDNDYMTFPYKIGVHKCVGNCNDAENLYFKVCLPENVKNISAKVFDMISQQNKFRNITFHESCKCGCLLDEKVCSNAQKWNKEKCRCECLKIKDCDVGFSRNVVNYSCELKKMAALIVEEQCDVKSDDIIQNKK